MTCCPAPRSEFTRLHGFAAALAFVEKARHLFLRDRCAPLAGLARHAREQLDLDIGRWLAADLLAQSDDLGLLTPGLGRARAGHGQSLARATAGQSPHTSATFSATMPTSGPPGNGKVPWPGAGLL